MQSDQRFKRLLTIICLIAVAAGFWLFNPFPLYFLNDDFIHIPLSRDGIFFQRHSFRPVCDLSIRIDYLLWRKKAFGYHITNLFLHVIDSVLVGVLSIQLFKKYTNIAAVTGGICTAVLFFIYPFHSESIFWIIGRSGSLGALFFLPAIIFYLRRLEGLRYSILSILFFIAGLITYRVDMGISFHSNSC